jgi:hypothetical protein
VLQLPSQRNLMRRGVVASRDRFDDREHLTAVVAVGKGDRMPRGEYRRVSTVLDLVAETEVDI